MRATGWLFAAGILLLLLDRLLLRAERAGWLYYRKTQPSPGALSSALANIHGVFEPEKRHIAEVQQQPEIQVAEAGAPPDPRALFKVLPKEE